MFLGSEACCILSGITGISSILPISSGAGFSVTRTLGDLHSSWTTPSAGVNPVEEPFPPKLKSAGFSDRVSLCTIPSGGTYSDDRNPPSPSPKTGRSIDCIGSPTRSFQFISIVLTPWLIDCPASTPSVLAAASATGWYVPSLNLTTDGPDNSLAHQGIV